MLNSPETEDFYKKPPRIQLTRLIIWMGVVGLGVSFIPLFLISTTLRENYQLIQTEVDSIQVMLDTESVLSDTQQSLRDDLLQVQTLLSQFDDVRTRLLNDQVEWAGLMTIIGSYDPASLALTGVIQNARQITLTGKGNDEADVMRYTETLRAAGLFERVTIQTIMLDTSTATLVPVAATPVNTPSAFTKPVNFTLLLELKANQP